jgi:hypothetical protein
LCDDPEKYNSERTVVRKKENKEERSNKNERQRKSKREREREKRSTTCGRARKAEFSVGCINAQYPSY